MRLHDSPNDTPTRRRINCTASSRDCLSLGLFVVGGLLAYALGVPLLIVVIFGIVTVGLVIFTT